MYYYYVMSHMQLYIAGAVATLIIGSIAYFGIYRTDTPRDDSTWQSSGGLFSWGEPESAPPPSDISYRGDGVQDLGVVPLPPVVIGAGGQNELANDLTKLLTQLTKPTTMDEAEDFTPSSYSFIPAGLISTGATRTRSPDAQAYYEYGNSIGGALQAFADAHPNMPQTLKDQAEDRADGLKVAALKRLAEDFTNLGNELAVTDNVPASALSAHQALAAAYTDVGAKLRVIPDATNDEEFLAAVNTYNSSAEMLSRRLIGLADLFATRDAGFTSSDAGSIFIFSGN